MRAVDTNIVVRYLTRDDPSQAERARQIIGHEPIFVPRTVLLEVEWVLRGVYGLPADRVISALRAFAGLPGMMVEDPVLVARAMDWADSGLDFANALHLAAALACDGFLTFDKRFARAATALGSVSVETP